MDLHLVRDVEHFKLGTRSTPVGFVQNYLRTKWQPLRFFSVIYICHIANLWRIMNPSTSGVFEFTTRIALLRLYAVWMVKLAISVLAFDSVLANVFRSATTTRFRGDGFIQTMHKLATFILFIAIHPKIANFWFLTLSYFRHIIMSETATIILFIAFLVKPTKLLLLMVLVAFVKRPRSIRSNRFPTIFLLNLQKLRVRDCTVLKQLLCHLHFFWVLIWQLIDVIYFFRSLSTRISRRLLTLVSLSKRLWILLLAAAFGLDLRCHLEN